MLNFLRKLVHREPKPDRAKTILEQTLELIELESRVLRKLPFNSVKGAAIKEEEKDA